MIPVAVWAALALVVIVLAIYRYKIASKDDGMVHVADSEQGVAAEQALIVRKLDVIDRWGKSLTVVLVLFGLALAGYFLYQQWTELGRTTY
jgi:hypothetical protein